MNATDLELMHQWMLSTFAGFGYCSGDKLMRRNEIQRLAVKQPFLMRGLLAVTALHVGRLHPEQKPTCLALAAHHQNLALPAYRFFVEDIGQRMTPDNVDAIIDSSHLTTAYAFASPYPPGSVLFAGLCSSDGVPKWLLRLRGAQNITNLAAARGLVAHGPLGSILQHIPALLDLSLSPEHAELSTLASRLDGVHASNLEEEEELNHYKEAVSLLRQTFAIPYQPGDTLGLKWSVFKWVEMTSPFLSHLIKRPATAGTRHSGPSMCIAEEV